MEDQFIINQVLAGNTDAFRFLVLRYQKAVFRYLRNFNLTQEKIEEIAQDVFIKAYKNLTGYQSERAQFNTWLFIIAKNTALNSISKHSSINEILHKDNHEEVDEQTPLSHFEQKELKKNMSKLLDQLPVQHKSIITLFHFNELSLEEISKVEDCSLGTVKSRLHRAKLLLKEIVIKKYGMESL